MAYSRYATELKDKENNIYGIMDGEARDYKADAINEVIDTPASVQSFPDGADNLPMSLTVGVEPVQDLHGYDNPWPAGGGKNLFPIEIETQTINECVFTIVKNTSGAVIEVDVNGTPTANATLQLFSNTNKSLASLGLDTTTEYTLTGCPSGGGSSTYYLRFQAWGGTGVDLTDNGSGATGSLGGSTDDSRRLVIFVKSGQAMSHVKFYPMLRLASVADATFVPYSNICPISGWTGANVTRTDSIVPLNANYIMKKYINDSGDVASNANYKYCDDYILVKPNTVYTILLNISTSYAGVFSVAFYNGSKTFISRSIVIENGQVAGEKNATFTTPANTAYIRFSLPIDISVGQFAIAEGSIITLYDELYEFPITFPSQAGTVYGGELTINKDGSGELVVDHASVDLGDLSWTYGSGYFRTNSINSTVIRPTDNTTVPDIISDIYTTANWNTTKDFCIYIVPTTQSQTTYVWISNSQYNDADAFKTAMSGHQMVYKLATPVTYSITPGQVKTLLGANNIFADCGPVLEITAPRDTKLYIDERIAELQALILENIGG